MATELLTAQTSEALGAWARLYFAHSELDIEFNRRLTAEHGLTVRDYEVLLLLAHADDEAMRRIDLADRVKLTASGITRLLDGLRDSGLVKNHRCPEDARVTYAKLTDSGRAKLEAAAGTYVAAVEAVFEERYSKRELETLAKLLSRLPGADAVDPDECTP
jgi:DNA-binding MarR family transcriptional regulator